MKLSRSKLYPICDRLESRTLFSTSLAYAVTADNVKLAADRAHLAMDRQALTPVVTDDRTQLKTDFSAQVTAGTDQYKTDLAAARLVIQTDQTNGNINLKNDRATILADRKSIALDRKNPTAEATDVTKLASDRAILTTDTANLKTTLTHDRTNLATQRKTDLTNLNVIRHQSTDLLIADKNKIAADLKSNASLFGADLKTISTDLVKLGEDEALLKASNYLNSLI